MTVFFRDSFISPDLDVIRQGALPQVGFVPVGSNRSYEGSSNPNPMRRSPEGARTLGGAGGQRIVYGLDVSDIGGEAGHGDSWVPGSADGWTATWDWHLDYYDARDGSSQNFGEIQLGNARTKNILVEFLQIGAGRIDLRMGHGATGYGGSPGSARVQCPDINAVGTYPCRLEVTRDMLTLRCGGGQLVLPMQRDDNAGGFNSLVIFLQSSLQLANLEISVGEVAPPDDPKPFWTGFVNTVET